MFILFRCVRACVFVFLCLQKCVRWVFFISFIFDSWVFRWCAQKWKIKWTKPFFFSHMKYIRYPMLPIWNTKWQKNKRRIMFLFASLNVRVHGMKKKSLQNWYIYEYTWPYHIDVIFIQAQATQKTHAQHITHTHTHIRPHVRMLEYANKGNGKTRMISDNDKNNIWDLVPKRATHQINSIHGKLLLKQ